MVRKKKRKLSATRRLHRTIGAGAALFVVFMVVSGLALNHSNGLGLDRRQVSQPSLLDWYGLDGPEAILSFELGGEWLSFAGSQLYLGERPVATLGGGVGAVSGGDLLIAASGDELLLLDHGGNLVERLPWSAIDTSAIEAIGISRDNHVLVKSGGRTWSADADLLNWRQTGESAAVTNWSAPKAAPGSIQQAISQSYRGDGLNLERVILDLHSGRIFGSVGVFIYDLLALTLGFLAISGLVLWFRSRSKGKSK